MLWLQSSHLIATLAVSPTDFALKFTKIYSMSNVVKVFTEKEIVNNNFPLAINFSRKSMPSSNLNVYHNIGIY